MKRILFSALLLSVSAQVNANTPCSSPKIYVENGIRHIISNGISCQHGQFPNSGNPNRISAQNYHFQVPVKPVTSGSARPVHGYLFGVAINGVPFDPGTAEYLNNDRSSGWNYDAMTGFTNLGLDSNHAHVQPTGAYHYHGVPTSVVSGLENTMALIGYAADGFPIYYKYGYQDAKSKISGLVALRSSYQLRSGNRPNPPGGKYDGRFVQDFIYLSGAGDLDECNGRFGVTPEYPAGTYHYFITDAFPFVPRCFKGNPDQSFAKRGPGRHGHGQRPDHGHEHRHMRRPPPPPPRW